MNVLIGALAPRRVHPLRRRDLITSLAATAAAWPIAARARQKAMPVIGLLSSFSRQRSPLGSGPVAQGLRETGYVMDRTSR